VYKFIEPPVGKVYGEFRGGEVVILEFHSDVLEAGVGTFVDAKVPGGALTAEIQVILQMRELPHAKRAYLLGEVLGQYRVLAIWQRISGALHYVARSPAFQGEIKFPYKFEHMQTALTATLGNEIPCLDDARQWVLPQFRGNISSVILFHPKHRIIAAWEREGDNISVVAVNPLLYAA